MSAPVEYRMTVLAPHRFDHRLGWFWRSDGAIKLTPMYLGDPQRHMAAWAACYSRGVIGWGEPAPADE